MKAFITGAPRLRRPLGPHGSCLPLRDHRPGPAPLSGKGRRAAWSSPGTRLSAPALIGQKFTHAPYFHGRPSANDYDATNSGGTNFGPSNAKFIEEVGKADRTVRQENGLVCHGPCPRGPGPRLRAAASIPTSASRLRLVQSARVAKARGLSEEQGIGPRPGLGRPPLDREAEKWSMSSISTFPKTPIVDTPSGFGSRPP